MSLTPAQTLIRAVEAANSSEQLVDAMRDLAEARLPEALPLLIEALGYNNPGAAVAAVDGLVWLGEAAVPALMTQIDDYNYTARAWAVRALAGIGDVRALETLLEAAQEDFSMSVRRAAARGLGFLRWHQFPAETLGETQMRIMAALLQVSQDPEWIVRYAAVTGLHGLAQAMVKSDIEARSQILTHLAHLSTTDATVAVQARACLACQQLDAAETILRESASWRSALERLYARKAQERPLAEGDPRRFRAVATALRPPTPPPATPAPTDAPDASG